MNNRSGACTCRVASTLAPSLDGTDEVQVLFATIGLVVSIGGSEEAASSIFIFSNKRSVTILRSRRFSIVNSSRTRRISAMVDGGAVDGSAGRLGAGLTSPLRSESFRQRWNVITLTPSALQICTWDLPARANSSAWPSLSRISWRECFFIVLSGATRTTATAIHPPRSINYTNSTVIGNLTGCNKKQAAAVFCPAQIPLLGVQRLINVIRNVKQERQYDAYAVAAPSQHGRLGRIRDWLIGSGSGDFPRHGAAEPASLWSAGRDPAPTRLAHGLK